MRSDDSPRSTSGGTTSGASTGGVGFRATGRGRGRGRGGGAIIAPALDAAASAGLVAGGGAPGAARDGAPPTTVAARRRPFAGCAPCTRPLRANDPAPPSDSALFASDSESESCAAKIARAVFAAWRRGSGASAGVGASIVCMCCYANMKRDCRVDGVPRVWRNGGERRRSFFVTFHASGHRCDIMDASFRMRHDRVGIMTAVRRRCATPGLAARTS